MATNPSVRAASVPALVAGFATVYVVWGSTYLAIRFAVETIPPLLMAGCRFVVAGGLLWAALSWRRLPRPNWRQCRAAAGIGVLLLLCGNGLVCWAEQWVPSGVTALIVGTVPLWMVLLEWLAHGGRRPAPRVFAGVVLGFTGVAMLALSIESSADSSAPGQAAAVRWGIAGLLIACVTWSIGSLRSRRVDQGPSLLRASAVQMLVGGVGLLVVGSIRGEWARFDPQIVSAASLLSVVYLILIGSLIGFSTYVWLLQVASPAAVSTYAYVNPVVAVLLGVWLGGETLGAWSLLAGALIVSAVALMMVPRPKPPLPSVAAEPAPAPISSAS